MLGGVDLSNENPRKIYSDLSVGWDQLQLGVGPAFATCLNQIHRISPMCFPHVSHKKRGCCCCHLTSSHMGWSQQLPKLTQQGVFPVEVKILPNSEVGVEIPGVIIPTQTMHCYQGKSLKNGPRFVLFDSTIMGNLMTPVERFLTSQMMLEDIQRQLVLWWCDITKWDFDHLCWWPSKSSNNFSVCQPKMVGHLWSFYSCAFLLPNSWKQGGGGSTQSLTLTTFTTLRISPIHSFGGSKCTQASSTQTAKQPPFDAKKNFTVQIPEAQNQEQRKSA